MSFTSLLDKTMAVLSVANTMDAYGGNSVTTTTVHSAIACRVRPMAIDEELRLARDGVTAAYKFYCDGNATVSVGYRLIVSGVTYPVTHVRDIDVQGHHLEILARRPA